MIPRRRPALGLPAIVGAAISIALVAFGFAAASADPFSVIADFNVVLQPNALHGFLLGTVSGARGYVVEVSPLEPAVAGARVTALTEPEFHGPSGIWFDVARVLLQGASAPLHVNIRIYATAAEPRSSRSFAPNRRAPRGTTSRALLCSMPTARSMPTSGSTR